MTIGDRTHAIRDALPSAAIRPPLCVGSGGCDDAPRDRCGPSQAVRSESQNRELIDPPSTSDARSELERLRAVQQAAIALASCVRVVRDIPSDAQWQLVRELADEVFLKVSST
jgi:hypothetical protein